MNKYFVKYPIAKMAKDNGFDEDCFAIFFNPKEDPYIGGVLRKNSHYNSICAPLYDQLREWFLKNHQLSIEVKYYNLSNQHYWGYDIVHISKKRPIEADQSSFGFDTYYSAYDKAFREAFKLIPKTNG